MKKNNLIAMILAGGRGSRLYDLTSKHAKPAIYFGGKYRIIDFPLSNCANSNISTVGVLTQYENVLLNSYVARDQYWGLNSAYGGVFVLPPREKETSNFDVYTGTADAIYQNLDFLQQMNASQVLVLSGDHIYKMDYTHMLKKHIESKASCTIGVIKVNKKDASRFGIMSVDKDGFIDDFQEKPKVPKSLLASMGIYIFDFKVLKKYLIKDSKDKNSSHDFGHDIIPAFIKDNIKCFAYKFDGYWKDVGTIESLWEANLDLLNSDNKLDLSDPNWKIYSENINYLPQYIGEDAKIVNSLINQGSYINGYVKNSIIFHNVKIEKDCKVIDSVIMPGTIIKNKTIIKKAVVSEGCIIDNENLKDKDNKVLLVTNKRRDNG